MPHVLQSLLSPSQARRIQPTSSNATHGAFHGAWAAATLQEARTRCGMRLLHPSIRLGIAECQPVPRDLCADPRFFRHSTSFAASPSRACRLRRPQASKRTHNGLLKVHHRDRRDKWDRAGGRKGPSCRPGGPRNRHWQGKLCSMAGADGRHRQGPCHPTSSSLHAISSTSTPCVTSVPSGLILSPLSSSTLAS